MPGFSQLSLLFSYFKTLISHSFRNFCKFYHSKISTCMVIWFLSIFKHKHLQMQPSICFTSQIFVNVTLIPDDSLVWGLLRLTPIISFCRRDGTDRDEPILLSFSLIFLSSNSFFLAYYAQYFARSCNILLKGQLYCQLLYSNITHIYI